MKDEMTIRSERVGEAVVLTPVGDIDLHRSPDLREKIRSVQSSRPFKVVVDLSEVEYMDSSGVATLVEALQHARRASTQVVLCCMQDRVRSIFEIARLETVFTIVPTRDEAVQV